MERRKRSTPLAWTEKICYNVGMRRHCRRAASPQSVLREVTAHFGRWGGYFFLQRTTTSVTISTSIIQKWKIPSYVTILSSPFRQVSRGAGIGIQKVFRPQVRTRARVRRGLTATVSAVPTIFYHIRRGSARQMLSVSEADAVIGQAPPTKAKEPKDPSPFPDRKRRGDLFCPKLL